MNNVRILLFALIIGSTLAGCAQKGVRKDPDALYYRLGGRDAMGKLVTDTVEFWANDKRIVESKAIKEKIEQTDLRQLKRNLFSFLCMASNGPCSFKSGSLQATMKSLRITQLEWYYMLEGIVASMNKHNVPTREQNEVLSLVYSMRKHIVVD